MNKSTFITSRDPIIGWEAIGRSGHRTHRLHDAVEAAWKEHNLMVNNMMDGKATPEDVERLRVFAVRVEADSRRCRCDERRDAVCDACREYIQRKHGDEIPNAY